MELFCRARILVQSVLDILDIIVIRHNIIIIDAAAMFYHVLQTKSMPELGSFHIGFAFPCAIHSEALPRSNTASISQGSSSCASAALSCSSSSSSVSATAGKKTPVFSQLFLCLSRACLGLMLGFLVSKLAQQRRVFLPVLLHPCPSAMAAKFK